MIRTDLDVPVFVFETESDVLGSDLADRQPDTDKFRLWEVTGTSHYDYYGLNIGPADTGRRPGRGPEPRDDATPAEDDPGPVTFSCNLPINTGGAHWVLDAADLRAERVGGQRHAASARRADEDHERVTGGVRRRRERQRPRRRALAVRRRADREARRRRQRRDRSGREILRPLRHHRALHREPSWRRLYKDHDAFVARVGSGGEQAVKGGFLREPTLRSCTTRRPPSTWPE